ERGLAGAVAADQADALAGFDVELDVAEDLLVAEGERDVIEADEGHGSRGVAKKAAMIPALFPGVSALAGSFAGSCGAARLRRVETPGRPAALKIEAVCHCAVWSREIGVRLRFQSLPAIIFQNLSEIAV